MFNALIISYLFLGGMGAGSFFVLVCVWALSSRMALAGRVANPVLRPGYRSFLGMGFGASLIIQMLGVLCLMADLKHPQAIPHLVIDPQLTVVSVGAYALALLVLLTLVLALSRLGFVGLPRAAEGVVGCLGAADSCVVMVYTALLLRACLGHPFWASPFIPVLFVISALSTGVACVIAVSVLACGHASTKGMVKKLLVVDLVLIAAELVTVFSFMAVGLFATPVSPAYSELYSGALSEVFWLGFVGLGLLAPAALNVCERRLPTAFVNPLVISALVMVGGVCLRYCIVGAGVLW